MLNQIIGRNHKKLLALLAVLCSLLFVFRICTVHTTSKCDYPELDVSTLDKVILRMRDQTEQHVELENMVNKIKTLMTNSSRVHSLESENKVLLGELKRHISTEEKLKEERKKLISAEITQSRVAISPSTDLAGPAGLPGIKEETLKRRVLDDAKELLYSIESNLKKLEGAPGVEEVMSLIREQHTGMLVDIDNLNNVNNDWKEAEAKELEELVQRRIHYIQNPKNCATSRKLICNLNKKCGFGCQIHHINYCLMIAFGTQRTFILISNKWTYNKKGWEDVFQPLSATCTERAKPIPDLWSDKTSDSLEVILPSAEILQSPPPYIPPNIPEDIASRLKRLHGNPAVWWVGQFVKYLFRGQPWLEADLIKYEKEVDFSKPIVGIQVRRTDKIGSEASSHEIEEYMIHVERWYDKYDMMHNVEHRAIRRVFLATDEAKVAKEAQEKFPQYKFINIAEFSHAAAESRYTAESLRGVITDIHLLSKCDYLVCTFSSQVCRVAYELMQTLHPDASAFFHSLDDIYYYGGQSSHYQEAIYDHQPVPGSKEIELKAGDRVVTLGNHWDGFSMGVNQRTGVKGLYPSWKVEEFVSQIKYPTYPEATKS